mmetsp:Transcript_13868/g.37501  ORF Transcript_13868/g.37501 Transcript_13868/m.37501 type:complete len:305 (-) Transcript_13868:631-1545(-)
MACKIVQSNGPLKPTQMLFHTNDTSMLLCSKQTKEVRVSKSVPGIMSKHGWYCRRRSSSSYHTSLLSLSLLWLFSGATPSCKPQVREKRQRKLLIFNTHVHILHILQPNLPGAELGHTYSTTEQKHVLHSTTCLGHTTSQVAVLSAQGQRMLSQLLQPRQHLPPAGPAGRISCQHPFHKITELPSMPPCRPHPLTSTAPTTVVLMCSTGLCLANRADSISITTSGSSSRAWGLCIRGSGVGGTSPVSSGVVLSQSRALLACEPQICPRPKGNAVRDGCVVQAAEQHAAGQQLVCQAPKGPHIRG